MKIKKTSIVKTFLIVFLVLTIFVPLASMLVSMTQKDILGVLGSKLFRESAKNSIVLAAFVTLLVLVLILPFAFGVAKTGLKHGEFFTNWATLPMLIPSISHGMGLIFLLGQNGILTNIFGINIHIYGFKGIVAGSIMYSFPIALIMLLDVMKYEDNSPYEAAQLLGIPRWRQFFAITMPFLIKPLISVAFTVFSLVITDYGVPLILGGQYNTLPVMMYNEVIGLRNFGKGSVIGVTLLLPAVIAFIIDIFLKKDEGGVFVTKTNKKKGKPITRVFATIYCLAVCILGSIPIFSFAFLSFVKKYPTNTSFSLDNIKKAFDMGAGNYLGNSLKIAFFVSVLGVIITYASAYITSRTNSKTNKILHLCSIISMSIPGLVLGLSYVIFFNATPIYGTLFILVLVNIIHFFSSPYLVAHNSLGKINKNFEPVGSTLGVSRGKIIRDVIIPTSISSILEMFSYFFVNSMMTISAVSFLSVISTQPVSLMIPQFESQMLLESSAFISLLILVINIIFKVVLYFIKKTVKGVSHE